MPVWAGMLMVVVNGNRFRRWNQCRLQWQRLWLRVSYGLLGKESILHPWASPSNLILIVSEGHTRPCNWSFSTRLRFYDQLSFSNSMHSLLLLSMCLPLFLPFFFLSLLHHQVSDRHKWLMCHYFSLYITYIYHFGSCQLYYHSTGTGAFCFLGIS